MTRHFTKLPSNRQLKVGQEIHSLVSSAFIQKEFYHPALKDVMFTISEVRISPDLKVASIFIIFEASLDRISIMRGLKEIVNDIRKIIADKLNLRYCPKIRFIYDDTNENVNNLEHIFHTLQKNSSK